VLYFASSYILFRSHLKISFNKKIIGKDFLQKQLVCHFCCRRQVANISDSVLWSTERARQRRILRVANESETDCTPEECRFQTASAFTHRQWPSFRGRTLWPTKASLQAQHSFGLLLNRTLHTHPSIQMPVLVQYNNYSHTDNPYLYAMRGGSEVAEAPKTDHFLSGFFCCSSCSYENRQ
jgi:hypothetical protein